MIVRSFILCLLTVAGFVTATAMAEPVGGYVAEPLDGSYEDERQPARGNTTMLEMYMRLERLQQDQQQLLGTLEEQGYIIEGLKRRQRELYLDIDRRLARLEKDGGAGTSGFTSESSSSMRSGCQSAPGGCEAPGAMSPRTEQGAPAQPASAQAGGSAEERAQYQQAFNSLRELNYAQAINGFREFLQTYPEGVYAHMAQYWMGEANYTQRQFQLAISDYRHLIDNYPQSPKLAEAMLKIGYSQEELGDKAAAMQTLGALEKRFPGSTEAGQARKLLLRLRSQP
ncbi:MAG: tol-pal system protein YbgF [Gammaproteobacteria bacterium]|nr:tol-pal system protein YbgF [Gammaproteobacteria bacterium]